MIVRLDDTVIDTGKVTELSPIYNKDDANDELYFWIRYAGEASRKVLWNLPIKLEIDLKCKPGDAIIWSWKIPDRTKKIMALNFLQPRLDFLVECLLEDQIPNKPRQTAPTEFSCPKRVPKFSSNGGTLYINGVEASAYEATQYK